MLQIIRNISTCFKYDENDATVNLPHWNFSMGDLPHSNFQKFTPLINTIMLVNKGKVEYFDAFLID